LGVITISRGCFGRCCSNKKTPPYPHPNLSFETLRNRLPTLLRASAYRTPSEASPRRRCGHASRFLRVNPNLPNRSFPGIAEWRLALLGWRGAEHSGRVGRAQEGRQAAVGGDRGRRRLEDQGEPVTYIQFRSTP